MNYLTVKEFAEIAGISKQAVYKKTKNPAFKQYIKKIDDTIMISEDALTSNQVDKLHNNKVDNHVDILATTIENLVERIQEQKKSDCDACELKKEKEHIQKQLDLAIELSHKQLEQISQLHQQLADKDKLIEEQSRRILEQTRSPVIIKQPRLTIFKKLRWKFFKK